MHLSAKMLSCVLPGYQTWMDVDRMSGSTLEAMAKAVEGSAVVLMCVSKKYKESQVGEVDRVATTWKTSMTAPHQGGTWDESPAHAHRGVRFFKPPS